MYARTTSAVVVILLLGLGAPRASAQQPVVHQWNVFETSFTATNEYENPFRDVEAQATFTAPSGTEHSVRLFFDGNGVWKVRFAPNETGSWDYSIASRPSDEGLQQSGQFKVVAPAPDVHGFLDTTPEQKWDFRYEDGTSVFLLGDTMYNLFGAAASGQDYEKMLLRRKSRGFNLFRARLQVSSFHPPRALNVWQKRDLWPWGGTRENPNFFRLDVDWFRTVDEIVQFCQDNGIGLEMILEAWGFEFPFNDREAFDKEAEDFWVRYIIARYGAYRSVYYWTLHNEYEYYPDGEWDYDEEANPWAEQLTRKVKRWDPHGHPVAVHNGPSKPPFTERFGPDTPIDLFAFQTWGTTDENNAWLAAGIDSAIARQREGLGRALLLSEYGYERTRHRPITFDGFRWLYDGHLRRGGWRGAFSGVPVIAGFQMTWAPFFSFHETEGLKQIEHLARFVRTRVPYFEMQPAHDRVQLINGPDDLPGMKALCLMGTEPNAIAVYLPVGGTVKVDVPSDMADRQWIWYNPVTGAETTAAVERSGNQVTATAPGGGGNRPQDWVLYLNDNS